MRFFRLLKIIFTIHQYGLYKILKDYHKNSVLAVLIETLLFFIPIKSKEKSLPERTRLAFEHLGPVFVKFGQLLSTRQDLIPDEYIVELSKLQSQVKPFAGSVAKQIVEVSLKNKIENIFYDFSDEAVASASIAQVHKARLITTNQVVAVKILRPNIEKIIINDIKVLKLAAWFIEKVYKDGKRLRPQEVVLEFEKVIHAELDFLQEAANATELRRLHKKDSHIIIIPQLYFDYCTNDVLVLEWMDGIPIANLAKLKDAGIDLKKLSHDGVTIFYTQVFHYGFFHADMHPGNILCDNRGRYIGLDFGIVGCLSEEDKRYLAINILAFFNRDYKKVAVTHIESGWAPKNTSVEELESAIRSICEPIFNKPLAQISFGQVLVKLFQVSRRFGIVVQPQLVLLQKTIVNVEGLGRLLNPQLDLWVTAKPILEKWMREQMGWRGLLKNLKAEAPYWSYTLPKLPRAFADSLVNAEEVKTQNNDYIKLLGSYKRQNQLLIMVIIIGIIAFLYKL
ncbi:MAG: ubiquinone biosynthesis regulatory protein kinase UbiB [Burkholderiales bacterium]|nr:ubiquinone biosynthesis regulatory protein kinase UbiB [Burkholderiales bacterium]